MRSPESLPPTAYEIQVRRRNTLGLNRIPSHRIVHGRLFRSIVAVIRCHYVREQAAHSSVTDMLISIYAKYLTKTDVEQLITFYRSPVGKRLASVTPALTLESAKIGQQWGESIAPGLQSRLLEPLRDEQLIP